VIIEDIPTVAMQNNKNSTIMLSCLNYRAQAAVLFEGAVPALLAADAGPLLQVGQLYVFVALLGNGDVFVPPAHAGQ